MKDRSKLEPSQVNERMGLNLAVKTEAPAGLNGFDILLLPAAKGKRKKKIPWDPSGTIWLVSIP